MIRVIIFLIAVGLIAVGVGWFADRPGEVAITWQGWRIETSLMVLSAAEFLVTEVVILGIVLIGVVAYLFDLFLRWMEQVLVPWKGKA